MSFSRTFIAAAAVLLMGGVAFAAPTATKQATDANANSSMTKSPTHHEWGVVQSMTDTDLTLTHMYKGKTETSTFKLDPNTKKMGTIDQGSRVEVFYKNENGDHIATEVKMAKSKTASSQ
ncbi:MAG TPA: hypothetical protein VMF66_20640 [Candidatus Acidoferrum sp.]|nr:hypothetical protein [Candidatus Acidoferrum sp.]